MISRDTVINSTIKTADTTTMPAIAPTGTLLLDSASVAVGTDGVTVGASGTDGVTVGASVADGVTVCVVGVEPLQSTSKYSQPVNSGVGEGQLMRLFSVPLHSGTLSLTPATAARVLYSPV